MLAIGIVITLPVLQNEPVTKFASSGEGPVFAGALGRCARRCAA